MTTPKEIKRIYKTFLSMGNLEKDLVSNPQIKTWDEFKVNYCLHLCGYYCTDEFNEDCNILKSRLRVYEYVRIKGNKIE